MNLSSTVLLNRMLARGKFRHVQVLMELAELGSVQRAANAMGMTQSSVTQSLAYIEQLLGVPLFQRHARGVRPTLICQDLLPVLRQIMGGLGAGAETIAAHQSEGQGLVRLLASAAAINGVLLPALVRFHDEHPRVQLQMQEAEREDLLLRVSSGQADLAVCRRPAVVPSHWRFEPLLEDHFVVVCGVTHPLAGSTSIDWNRLAAATWLLPPVGSMARDCFDELAQAWTAPAPTYPLITRSLLALIWLLRDRPLLSLLPYRSVKLWVDQGLLATLDLDHHLPLEGLGMLMPEGEGREATQVLVSFLSDGSATRKN
jgi:DNA-binding transcriptional LysR family regulator